MNSSRDSWLATLAARLVDPRPKVIRTRHISAPLNDNRATHLLYRRFFDMVIVTGGERNRQDLIHRDGLAPDRVAAFPIGLDVEHFSPAKPRQDIRSELGFRPVTCSSGSFPTFATTKATAILSRRLPRCGRNIRE